MDERGNRRLRRLEARVDKLSEALFDSQDQLIGERARNSALKLVLFTVVDNLIVNDKLNLGDVLKGLAEAEQQADPTDPARAELARELQEVRSELGRLFAPVQASLSHGVLATLQRGFRKGKLEGFINSKRLRC